MKTNIHFLSYIAHFFLEWRNVSDKLCRENQNTRVFSNSPPKNVPCIMWKNIVETDRPQMTIWRLCIACWIPTGRFTLYVTFPFRRGTSPFSKLFSCVIKRRCSHWQERLRHVSVPFRRRPQARMFDVTARVRRARFWSCEQYNYVISTALQVFTCDEACLIFFRNGWKINRIGT